MSNIFELNNNINFEEHILWQYANAECLKSLTSSKQNWYLKNHTKFWSNWIKDVLDISTANDFGLSIWGNLLQVPRTYEINGDMVTLDTEQYRLLLRGHLLYLRMNGSVPDINEYLKLIFKDYGTAFVRDNLDMTMTYILEFTPTEEQLVVMLNTGVLPRPGGVGIKIFVIPQNVVFGFENSGLTGFNQCPFWDCLDWNNK